MIRYIVHITKSTYDDLDFIFRDFKKRFPDNFVNYCALRLFGIVEIRGRMRLILSVHTQAERS